MPKGKGRPPRRVPVARRRPVPTTHRSPIRRASLRPICVIPLCAYRARRGALPPWPDKNSTEVAPQPLGPVALAAFIRAPPPPPQRINKSATAVFAPRAARPAHGFPWPPLDCGPREDCWCRTLSRDRKAAVAPTPMGLLRLQLGADRSRGSEAVRSACKASEAHGGGRTAGCQSVKSRGSTRAPRSRAIGRCDRGERGWQPRRRMPTPKRAQAEDHRDPGTATPAPQPEV